MFTPKLLLALMTVGIALSAPQFNQQEVVGQVMSQLQPAIQRALAGMNLGGSSSFSPAPTPPRRISPTSVSRPVLRGLSFQPVVSRSTTGSSATQLTSSVISSLQPAIAKAVADALASSSRGSSMGGGQAKPSYGPAKYSYEYKVANDDAQTYINQAESRDGMEVTGSYSFVDPTGSLVTVKYNAGPEGFTSTRSAEAGAVVMRNIPVGWDGPLAGAVVDNAKSTTTGNKKTKFDQEALIRQILASIQPQISSAVSKALGSTRTQAFPVAAARLPVVPRVVPRVAPVVPRISSVSTNVGQGNIVQNVLSSITPKIFAAVQSALSSVSRTSAVAPSTVETSGSSINSLFGVSGENKVNIKTPAFNIAY